MSNYEDEERVKFFTIKQKINSMLGLYDDLSLEIIDGYIIGETSIDPIYGSCLDKLISQFDKESVREYVAEAIKIKEKAKEITYDVDTNTLFAGDRGKCVLDDNDRSTAWGHYRALLELNRFSNIDEIKVASKNIIEMMKKDTKPNVPVRGAVIGNVQSGKTANMEAIISMAADNGWNFFIVLTGLTTNLMDQTRQRMLRDLRASEGDPSDPLRCCWTSIDPLTNPKEFNSNYEIRFDQNHKYICHAQKNPSHLKKLIQCLNKITRKRDIHLLVIDDEADQASVDSSGIKSFNRSTINQLILNLVKNNTHTSKDTEEKKNPVPFGSVNYIGYTATPYANLLNESKGLYPEDFITALTPSSLYMGLRQFYGDGQEDGLNEHVTIIDDNIKDIIKKKKTDDPINLPDSLKDCIAWFYCCIAILKGRKFKRPVSLLINVDIKVVEHAKMNRAVRDYILNDADDLKKRCREVYITQTNNLTLKMFKDILPDYAEGVDGYEIEDYPSYSSLESSIGDLIKNGLAYIKLDAEKKPIYTPGTIHDCVDNGTEKNVPLDIAGEEYTGRIIYPDKDTNSDVLADTPAFIVIGGQTLSRGLTIEGLVATYFIRKTPVADTCLQMARWFGFRSGYELLPRIWMDKRTYEAFCGLAVINESLFREIKKYHLDGVNPKDYHAKIRDVPAAGMLKSLTSKNKSKGSSKTYKNGGFRAKDKYFSHFFNDFDSLERNIRLTEDLISKYDGQPVGSGSYLFRNVPFDEVLKYLENLTHPLENKNVNSFDSFMGWLKKYDPNTLKDCNIVLYGTESESNDLEKPSRIFAGKYKVNMVQRGNLGIDNAVIKFKTVRDKSSLLLDLDLDKCKELLKEDPGAYEALLKGEPEGRCKVHKLLGMEKTATLSITTIGVDRDNVYANDIISPTIFIPGDVESDYDFDKFPYVYLEEDR